MAVNRYPSSHILHSLSTQTGYCRDKRGMTSILFLSVTPPTFSQRRPNLFHITSTTTTSINSHSSNLFSFSSAAEQVSPDAQAHSIPNNASSFSGGCTGCGREQVENGCNGEGRIQGGIATVPGFGWWPIKAYRPCPSFLESGGRYKRQGQSMDEVAFGTSEREISLVNNDTTDTRSRKKKQNPKRLKR